ncbi:myoglobin [Biomphalaria pfeifferi]|uniref:Myoglobin n=1 Tax=Biomphalaria pfeifferi TaxID=112525 RepID=A0AAD8BQT5_BIOPF|nr:myoglobin [Biomphalaria pfeifferi]
MSETVQFEEFEVSQVTGFAAEFVDSLPDYYSPWHELASHTVDLVTAQKMRSETEKLPLLDPSQLTDFKDLRLAHLQLVMITAGYAWEQGAEQVAQAIPANVAIPLCEISDKLGVQPGMSYFDIIGNWTRRDKHGPYSRQNIQPKYMLPGGEDYVGFLSLAIQMEVYFTKSFPAIQSILTAMKGKDEALALSALKDLQSWFKEYSSLAKEFHNVMQPDIFFRVITSFLRGFNETCGLPDGMLYEGVTDRPRRIVINSAASQATVFQIMDTLLGVRYPEDKQAFFKKLRTSWCEKHRQLFEMIQQWPGSLRDLAEKNSSPELTLAYNALVDSIKEFRSYHVQLVTKYTVIPNKRLRNEFNIESPDHFAYLMPLLKGIRDVSATNKLEV